MNLNLLPYHEFLQFVGLRAIMFHHCANSEERYETGCQEDGADNQINDEGNQDEYSHRISVPDTDVTDAAQDITCK